MKFDRLIYPACFIILFALLFRPPYSSYNSISNLEPFPDSFHYLVSANCLIKGYGLNICRNGDQIPSSVPVLYPLILSPIFIFSQDPRTFYFINILLITISAILFNLILKNIFTNSWQRGLLSLMFVTNYIIFWYPSFAMSENLLLPLFLASILFLLKPVNMLNLLFVSLLFISMVATKYMAISLSLPLFLVYLFRIINNKVNTHKAFINLILFTLSITIFLGIFFLSEYYIKGTNIIAWINQLFNYYVSLGDFFGSTVTTKIVTYSNNYFSSNFIQYFAALIGGKMRLLGLDIQIIPIMVGMIGLPVLLLSIFIERYRYVGIVLLMPFLGNLFFISRFRIVDERYIFTSIPILVIGFGIFLDLLQSYMKNKIPFSRYLIISVVTLVYFVSISPSIFEQLKINYFGDKPAWNYLSVISSNNFFSRNYVSKDKQQILLSVMPPYLFDFYSNHNYQIKPLSHAIYFGTTEEMLNKVYGEDNYSDLLNLYELYLEKGFSVFVSDYGVDRFMITKLDFEKVKNKFILEKVSSDCEDACNIYKMVSKKSS